MMHDDQINYNQKISTLPVLYFTLVLMVLFSITLPTTAKGEGLYIKKAVPTIDVRVGDSPYDITDSLEIDRAFKMALTKRQALCKECFQEAAVRNSLINEYDELVKKQKKLNKRYKKEIDYLDDVRSEDDYVKELVKLKNEDGKQADAIRKKLRSKIEDVDKYNRETPLKTKEIRLKEYAEANARLRDEVNAKREEAFEANKALKRCEEEKCKQTDIQQDQHAGLGVDQETAVVMPPENVGPVSIRLGTADASPIRHKTTGFSLTVEYSFINTGVLSKAGKASSESVDNLLGASADESGYGFGLVGGFGFAPKGTLGIIPRVEIAYQYMGGINFSEDFQIDSGFMVHSERELTGHGVRFGVGADIPLGNTKSWGLGFGLGGTYMKNTVDQTRTATDHGIEIGSIDNSASITTLNPYAEAKVTYEIGGYENYMAMKRWSAGGGVRIEKSTLLDDIQGEFSDTITSIFLEVKIPLGK